MTDNQLIERAEAKWPIDDEFSVQELVIQHERQEAYIAAYKEAIEEMSKGWVSVETPPDTLKLIIAGHWYNNKFLQEIIFYDRVNFPKYFTHWINLLPAPPSINKGETYDPSDDLPGGHPAI